MLTAVLAPVGVHPTGRVRKDLRRPPRRVITPAVVLLLCCALSGPASAGEAALPFLADAAAAMGSGPGSEAISAARAADSVLALQTTSVLSRPGLRFAKGVLVVRLAEGLRPRLAEGAPAATGSERLDAVLASRGLVRAERLFPWDCADRTGGECGFLRLTFPEETDLQQLMDELAAVEGVVSVEPAGVHRVNFYPNDPYLGFQWALNHVPDHDVNAPEAWDIERGDTSIVVGIVDTGVYWQHPDLGGAAPFTYGNIKTNWVEFNGAPGVDDDNNGFVDDIRGWDFVTGVGGTQCVGEDAEMPDNDPTDFFGHGTHLAGITAALTNNGVGVAGLANQCKVLPVRAGWCAQSAGGVVRMDFCAQGMMYAVRNGARIINCSWNSDNSGGLGVAADTAISRGAIIVVSAGNQANQSQTFNYLSTRNDCFDVAATDSNDVKYLNSSYGSWIDFSAPGEFVLSTYHTGEQPTVSYAWMDGTSMAAPHVSALSALLLSQDPARTRPLVRSIIASTCEPIDALNPSYAGLLGAGRIDAYAALSLASGDWKRLTGGRVTGSPLPLRVGLQKRVVVTSSDGCVYVFSSDGDLVPGWPKCLPGRLTSAAAGLMDADSSPDIVAASDSGYVAVWGAGGSLVRNWPLKLAAAVVSGPMLCDIDGDGQLEIVCGTADAALHVLESDATGGSMFVDFGGPPTSEPAFAAMGIDTSNVILIGTSDSKLNAIRQNGTPSPGWPVVLDTATFRSPGCADVDYDGRSEVFVGDSEGFVHGIDDLGTSLPGWPRSTPAAITRSLAIGDVNGDSLPDVVAASSNGAVYAWSLSGQMLSGWPVYAPGAIYSSPSVVDLDADGKCEVAVGCDDGNMYVWSPNGTPFAGWPRSTGGPIRSSPCLYDFDSDGEFELVVGSDDGKVHYWQVAASSAPDEITGWPMYRHDAYRSGNTGLKVKMPVPPPRARLAVVASPNPFGGTSQAVTFNISVTGTSQPPGGRRGTVLIFDVAGRAVAEVPVFGQGGELTASWDGGSRSSGRKLGAGVYNYSAEVDGLKAEGKLVFLKR